MKSIKHILFPFDFSEAGFDAAPFVRSLAKRWDAKVSVLTVFPPTWNAAPGGVLPLTGIDAPEQELQARQDQALAHEFTGP